MSATVQLPLIPTQPPTLGNMDYVSLSRLPPDQALLSPAPEHGLVESIRRWGVLEPILVRAVGGGLDYGDPATLITGRRRIKALRLLLAEAQAEVNKLSKSVPPETLLSEETVPGYGAAYERLKARQRIPVRVVSDPEGTRDDGRTEALLVMSNAVRSDNPAADFRALAYLVARLSVEGKTEKECLAEVTRATGLAPGTVKQRLRLLGLSPELQDDFMAGRLGYTVALHASRLGPDGQALLAEMLDQGHPATLALVKEAKRDSVRATQVTFLDALPEAPLEATSGAAGYDLLGHARALREQLQDVKMPIMQEAAGVIAGLLTRLEEQEADWRLHAENRSLNDD